MILLNCCRYDKTLTINDTAIPIDQEWYALNGYSNNSSGFNINLMRDKEISTTGSNKDIINYNSDGYLDDFAHEMLHLHRDIVAYKQ